MRKTLIAILSELKEINKKLDALTSRKKTKILMAGKELVKTENGYEWQKPSEK